MLALPVSALVAALCSSLLLASVDGVPVTDQLQLLSDEDPTCLVLLKLLSELMELRRAVMLQDDELGGSERLMRRHIRFTHRERKAGCRSFFWKTFTSC